jgi:fatty-acyl-CoA synthase
MAAIVLKDGVQSSAEEIISWSRENMSAYKIPRKISFMNSLPRSGSGKIQWRELQDLEWKN